METTMDKSEGQKKPKIHGTFVKVNDENIDEAAKAIMEMIRKIQR
jgi:hypothetical protein